MATWMQRIGGFTDWVFTPLDRWCDYMASWGFKLQERILNYFSGKISTTVWLAIGIVSLVIWGVVLFLAVCAYSDFTSKTIHKWLGIPENRAWVGFPMAEVMIPTVLGVVGWFFSIFQVRLLTGIGVVIQAFGLFLVIFTKLSDLIKHMKRRKRKRKQSGVRGQYPVCMCLLLLGCFIFASIFAFLAGLYIYVTIAIAFAWMIISMLGGAFESGGAGGGGGGKNDRPTPKDLPAYINLNGENYGLEKSYSWGADYKSSSGETIRITNVYSMGDGEASTNMGHITYNQ